MPNMNNSMRLATITALIVVATILLLASLGRDEDSSEPPA
jgi:hypothetical protein